MHDDRIPDVSVTSLRRPFRHLQPSPCGRPEHAGCGCGKRRTAARSRSPPTLPQAPFPDGKDVYKRQAQICAMKTGTGSLHGDPVPVFSGPADTGRRQSRGASTLRGGTARHHGDVYKRQGLYRVAFAAQGIARPVAWRFAVRVYLAEHLYDDGISAHGFVSQGYAQAAAAGLRDRGHRAGIMDGKP